MPGVAVGLPWQLTTAPPLLAPQCIAAACRPTTAARSGEARMDQGRAHSGDEAV